MPVEVTWRGHYRLQAARHLFDDIALNHIVLFQIVVVVEGNAALLSFFSFVNLRLGEGRKVVSRRPEGSCSGEQEARGVMQW
jgi:hypothetical protein